MKDKAGILHDRKWNTILKCLCFTSSSASLVNANDALNNMADGELFEMYNGFSEAYAHSLANRLYGTLADDLFDQNFVEIKGTAVEGVHSIYIETWRSLGVVDVESTVPKSGLFYDLWDTRQDLVNGLSSQLEIPSINWNTITNTGLGSAGLNTAPDRFTLWRNNLIGTTPSQTVSITNLFSYYQIQ